MNSRDAEARLFVAKSGVVVISIFSILSVLSIVLLVMYFFNSNPTYFELGIIGILTSPICIIITILLEKMYLNRFRKVYVSDENNMSDGYRNNRKV